MLISLSLAVEPVDGLTTVSVMHGQCDARPTVTFQTYARTKFILLGDSWLPRILILYLMRQNSLDLIFAHRPGSYPGRYAGPASEYVFSLTVAHATTAK